ncbi:MAG: hypothetical protein ACYDDZ_11000 [Acidimicrobiales bacterium]
MKHPTPVLPQGLAIALGVGALLVAVWAFEDAFESRGADRPGIVRLLPV